MFAYSREDFGVVDGVTGCAAQGGGQKSRGTRSRAEGRRSGVWSGVEGAGHRGQDIRARATRGRAEGRGPGDPGERAEGRGPYQLPVGKTRI